MSRCRSPKAGAERRAASRDTWVRDRLAVAVALAVLAMSAAHAMRSPSVTGHAGADGDTSIDTLVLRMSTTMSWPGAGTVPLPAGALPTAPLHAPPRPPLDTQLLAVRLNGVELDDVVATLNGPQGMALPDTTWAEMHLRVPDGPPLRFDGRDYRVLERVAGLNWRIDESSQTLVIDAPPAAFAGARVTMDSRPPPASVTSAPGGYANYELQWQRSTSAVGSGLGRDTTSALLEFGGFHAGGSGRLTALVRQGDQLGQRTRLDTTWVRDVPDKLASLRVGDSIGRAGAWGRAVRFGGVQWSTDFSMQPGFLAFPLPSMRGEAALPSTVDVYVNNTLRSQSQVPAGPFDLTDLPIVTGQGQVRMVVRDLLGREQVILQPYYVSPSLLRPGLTSFSYELGAIREDYGVESNHYGRAMATATHKRGLTERFTSELRAELVGRQLTAGTSGVLLIPSVGVGNLSVAGSQGPDGHGAMTALGLDHQGSNWSGTVQARYSTPGFRQLGQPRGPVGMAVSQMTGLPGSMYRNTPRLSLSSALGTSWRGTAMGVSVVEQQSWEGERTRVVSFNAGRDLGGFATLGLFVLRDVTNHANTVAITVSRVLDGRTSANATATRSRDPQQTSDYGSLQIQRSALDNQGFSYQATVDRGEQGRANVQGLWQGEKVALSGGYARSRGSDDLRLGASGGVAAVGGSVFMSRRIDGSFAVVEVGDYADVQVLHDNRPVARTDAKGRALVSGLRGYEPNRISVNASDLPFDAEVDGLELVLVSPARSGTSLKIPVTRSRSASFRLVDANGVAVPAGSLVRVPGGERRFPVGFDGKAFLSGMGLRTEIEASWPGHTCQAQVDLPAEADEMPELGTVSCL